MPFQKLLKINDPVACKSDPFFFERYIFFISKKYDASISKSWMFDGKGKIGIDVERGNTLWLFLLGVLPFFRFKFQRMTKSIRRHNYNWIVQFLVYDQASLITDGICWGLVSLE